MKTKKMFFPFLLILITIGIGACEEKESDSVSINQIEKNPRSTGYPHSMYKTSRTFDGICNSVVMYYKDL